MDRYDRQKRVRQIGPAGQAKLQQATILIVGVGGLGSYAAAALARAGVKRLILVDPDVVSLTNLQRQALFTEDDCLHRRFKVAAAKDHLREINNTVEVMAIPSPLTTDIIVDNQFDLCLDCLDNYGARDLLNQLAIKYNFDYLFASCAGSYGNVMAVSPREHPCLNCVFPNLDDLKQADCDLIGVNTALLPLIAGMQVSLALHYLVDRATIDFDHLITYDNWSMAANKFKVNKRTDCPSCQEDRPTVNQQDGSQQLRMLCGENAFYIRLSLPIELTAWVAYLKHAGLLKGSSPLFIHFSWHQRPVSLFRNGKLIMYDLPDCKNADQQLASLTKLAQSLTKEGKS